ncbi:MAG: hypothetical protein EOP49_04955 [Sphingobacteriales bacterium]|nr:MAG: hypothetical protein EOP49_04955 [Sphingobacteriales bacterium]
MNNFYFGLGPIEIIIVVLALVIMVTALRLLFKTRPFDTYWFVIIIVLQIFGAIAYLLKYAVDNKIWKKADK